MSGSSVRARGKWSRACIVTRSPTTPARSSSRTFATWGWWRYMKASARSTPAAAAAASTWSSSPAPRTSGFSQRTCLPVCAARVIQCACIALGSATYTASTSGSARSSSCAPYARGMPSSPAYDPARPLALLTARTSPHPERRIAGMTCSRAMRAAPSTPQRTDSTCAPLDDRFAADRGRARLSCPADLLLPTCSPGGRSPNLLMTAPAVGHPRRAISPARRPKGPPAWAE